MNGRAVFRRSLGNYLVVLGLGLVGATATGQAAAGCGMFPGHGAAPSGWMQEGKNHSRFKGTSIVGMWKVTLVSDGTSYPALIPAGVAIDFGTAQWHSDGTEILVSGGRAPSTGDVCMGVWEQTGSATTYKLKHIGLSYASSDSSPPAIPAAFVGPAIIYETVALSPSGNSYEGTFTIDQYQPDGLTLIEHIGGTVTAVRFTVD